MVLPAGDASRSMSVAEFLKLDVPEGYKVELVRGEVRMTPSAATAHMVVENNLAYLLQHYVREHGLGMAFAEGVSYELVPLPRTVREPDVSFIRDDRIPPGGVEGPLFRFAPDLAVEVRSPSERAKDIQEKVDDYLASGTPLVWVIDPRRRTVRVIATGAPERLLQESESLDGGNVIPGFSCPVSALFDRVARMR